MEEDEDEDPGFALALVLRIFLGEGRLYSSPGLMIVGKLDWEARSSGEVLYRLGELGSRC
jgi:hypothetical protein